MSPSPSQTVVTGLLQTLAATKTLNDHSHVISEAERLDRDLDALAYFDHRFGKPDHFIKRQVISGTSRDKGGEVDIRIAARGNITDN